MTAEDRWNELTTDSLTETDARRICTWHYPPPYDVYNYADWDTVVNCDWDLSKPEKRATEYIAFKYLNGLMAFGRISCAGEYALIGIGLRPDFCDRGIGPRVMMHLVGLARERHPQLTPALEVRTFNSRAIRCYRKCGFIPHKRYVRNTCTGKDAFYLMVYHGLTEATGIDPE